VKVGDLVRHRFKGWLALILAINEVDMTAEFVWLAWCSDGGEVDRCSTSFLEVVSESR